MLTSTGAVQHARLAWLALRAHCCRCCRDRAEERRRGINPDYESANQLASALPGDIDVSRLTVEESKFLGGDIAHTHLVKGLDFALLQKVGGPLWLPAWHAHAWLLCLPGGGGPDLM